MKNQESVSVEIIVSKDGLVDFKAPVFMTPRQQDLFIKYMKLKYQNVGLVEVPEPEINRSNTNKIYKKWESKDYVQLLLAVLKEKEPDEIIEKLGRNDMSIIIKIGKVLPEYLKWKKENSINEDSPESVRKYICSQDGD